MPSDGRQRYVQSPIASTTVARATCHGDGVLLFQDCQGTAPLFGGSSAALIQFPSDGRQRYLLAPVASSTVAGYLSDTCAGTVPFQLPAGFLGAGQSVLQTIARQTTAAGITLYLQIEIPSATHVSTYGPADEICDSCAFGQGSCPPSLSATGAVMVPLFHQSRPDLCT